MACCALPCAQSHAIRIGVTVFEGRIDLCSVHPGGLSAEPCRSLVHAKNCLKLVLSSAADADCSVSNRPPRSDLFRANLPRHGKQTRGDARILFFASPDASPAARLAVPTVSQNMLPAE